MVTRDLRRRDVVFSKITPLALGSVGVSFSISAPLVELRKIEPCLDLFGIYSKRPVQLKANRRA